MRREGGNSHIKNQLDSLRHLAIKHQRHTKTDRQTQNHIEYKLIFQSDVAVNAGSNVCKFDDGNTRLKNTLDIDWLRQNVLQEASDHFKSTLSKPSVTRRPQLAQEKQSILPFGKMAVIAHRLPTDTANNYAIITIQYLWDTTYYFTQNCCTISLSLSMIHPYW